MAIDLTTERPINLKAAAKHFPPYRGKPTHVSRVLRAILKGDLEAVRYGSQWATTAEAIQRYAQRCASPGPAPAAPPTLNGRRSAAEKAGKELAALGF
jgi:hypothetical protein